MNRSEEWLADYQAKRGKDPLQEVIVAHGFTPKRREYPITPLGKPRMTQRDKWKKRECVERYHAFKDECRTHRVTLNLSKDHVTFILPMPKSWSAKKRANMDGKPHQMKPDMDNMLKALWDAVMEQDCGIWDCRVTKLWGMEGQIIIQEAK